MVGVMGVWVGACGKSATTPTPVTDPPKIACPAPVNLTSPDGNPVLGTYGDPAVTGGQSPFLTTCTPVSGSRTFPVGATPITCTTTDAQKRSASCTFNITVSVPTFRIGLTKFVAFGDSITAGEDGTIPTVVPRGPTIIVPTPYPQGLGLALTSRYVSQAASIVVFNAGKPGEAASEATTLTRFSSVLSGSGGYQAVLIMEGSNDLSFKDNVVTQQALANIRQMIRDAKARGVRPFLATVPPEVPGGYRAGGAPYVAAYNTQLRSLAVSEGVTLIDVNQGFGTALTGLIADDGLHPTQAGYTKMADIFFQALKATLETTTSSSALSPAGLALDFRLHR